MADHANDPDSVIEKITEKIHSHGSSSSSDSDDDKPSKVDAIKALDEKPSKVDAVKANVYRLFGREKPVHKVLGGGKPADVFLWRNKKISGGVLGGATALWVLFELLEYQLITLVCHASILSLAIIFLWSNASTFINKATPHIPEVKLPEDCILQVASALRIEINRAICTLHDIASGRDLKKFLIAFISLWVLSIVGNWFNFVTLVYISFVLLHTVPLFYEKYEDHVDSFGEKALAEIKKQYAVFDAKVLSKVPRGPLKEKKKD